MLLCSSGIHTTSKKPWPSYFLCSSSALLYTSLWLTYLLLIKNTARSQVPGVGSLQTLTLCWLRLWDKVQFCTTSVIYLICNFLLTQYNYPGSLKMWLVLPNGLFWLKPWLKAFTKRVVFLFCFLRFFFLFYKKCLKAYENAFRLLWLRGTSANQAERSPKH